MASSSPQSYSVECVNLSSDQLAYFIAALKEKLPGYATGPKPGGELDLQSSPPREVVPFILYPENETENEKQILSAFQQALDALRLQLSNQLVSVRLFGPDGRQIDGIEPTSASV